MRNLQHQRTNYLRYPNGYEPNVCCTILPGSNCLCKLGLPRTVPWTLPTVCHQRSMDDSSWLVRFLSIFRKYHGWYLAGSYYLRCININLHTIRNCCKPSDSRSLILTKYLKNQRNLWFFFWLIKTPRLSGGQSKL